MIISFDFSDRYNVFLQILKLLVEKYLVCNLTKYDWAKILREKFGELFMKGSLSFILFE